MDLVHGKLSDDYHTSQHATRRRDTTAALDNELLKLGSGSKAEEETSSSSYTTSEDSSEEDFFQLDAIQLNKSIAKLDEPGNHSVPSIEAEIVPPETGFGYSNKHEVRNSGQDGGMVTGSMPSSKVPKGSAVSPGPFGGSTKTDALIFGVKQSPQIQAMLRSDVPDPKRIPSSVFARTKSNAPMEWSVASNESLFSIHMGKSGDLTGFYNSQFDNYPPLTSPGQAQYVNVGSCLQPQGSIETTNAEAGQNVSRIEQVPFEKEKPSIEGMPHSDSTSGLSDSSVNSYRSFAFPILTPDGRNTSVKAELMNQEEKKEQPQDPPPQVEPSNADPVAPQSKWFPCFSCCPSCC